MTTTGPALRTNADPLARLNPGQRAAVLHGDGRVAGPLLVIAGAGTGKTHTLVHRLAHLVRAGADPRRVLLMTFSRRAASEMVRRAERLAAETMGPKAEVLAQGLTWAGTYHAIGARLLREYAPAIGLDPGFTIHDREDSADLMAIARHDLGVAEGPRRFPAKATCLAIYSRAVNARTPLETVLRDVFPWCAEWGNELRALFAAYVEAKQSSVVLDYDDLLLYWHGLMQEAVLAGEISSRFDHVLVDEYQDTNRLQAEILLALRSDGRGLTVVGDDAQAIYGFRAADVRNILDFPDAFSPRATVVTLEQNYRSTPQILDASNAVIGAASEGFRKTLRSDRPDGPRPRLATVWDEAGQVDLVCRDVLAAREEGLTLKEQAVLFRTAHHSAPLEVELVRRNIPFVKFGGLKFLDAAHVKDMLATLRMIQNPRDRVSGFRVMQLVPGIGAATATSALDRVAGAADPAAALEAVRVPGRAVEPWAAFVQLFQRIRHGALGWPAEIEAIRQWYQPHLERRHDDAAMRQSELLQLEAIAAGFPDRATFLSEITLDPPSATSDESGAPLRDEDYLVLSTIHSAKGQEWRRVHLLNGVDGCIPSDLATGTSAEIEEERRLLYVAMTRARDVLTIVVPQRFYVHGQPKRGDRHVYASRTRFVPASLLPYFESVRIPVSAPPAGTACASAPVDLSARMRAMWK